jgi:hypothetical protein
VHARLLLTFRFAELLFRRLGESEKQTISVLIVLTNIAFFALVSAARFPLARACYLLLTLSLGFSAGLPVPAVPVLRGAHPAGSRSQRQRQLRRTGHGNDAHRCGLGECVFVCCSACCVCSPRCGASAEIAADKKAREVSWV